MPMEKIALASGCVCMALSTLGFQMMAGKDSKRFHYVAMAVTGIATMAYLAMFCGAGIKEVDGRNIYWMRYVDWFFTTPFFLLDLGLLARADMWDTFYVMLVNAICIVSGAIGALTPEARIPMFILGMITFVAFNMKLFGAMMAQAGNLGADVAKKYSTVTTLTMGIWCAYPVMYVLCEITGILPEGIEVCAYAVLDVIAKCYCGYLLLSNEDILVRADPADPAKRGLLA